MHKAHRQPLPVGLAHIEIDRLGALTPWLSLYRLEDRKPLPGEQLRKAETARLERRQIDAEPSCQRGIDVEDFAAPSG